MKSSLCYLQYFCLTLVLLQFGNVKGQGNRVSSKLDFDNTEDNNNNNTNVPIVPGTQQGRSDNRNGRPENTDGSTGSTGTNNANNDNRSRPKIHGVRVTVDTGDGENAKESKESVEITDIGKHKKRVGIHTDITFEISANGDDDNTTSSAQKTDEDKEDASVPIFKGRGGSRYKNRKPHDPKTHWNPNYSAEGRGYDGNWHGNNPSYAGYYPHYNPHNVPVYTGSVGTESRGASGTIYRREDGWNSYVPTASRWTTERSNTYYEPYRPNSVTGNRSPSWKPCYCITTDAENRRRRDNAHNTDILQPTSSVIQVIDSKLVNPFSKK